MTRGTNLSVCVPKKVLKGQDLEEINLVYASVTFHPKLEMEMAIRQLSFSPAFPSLRSGESHSFHIGIDTGPDYMTKGGEVDGWRK